MQVNKRCTFCSETKPLTDENFRPRPDRPGKFYARCRACDSVRYTQEHKERYKGKRQSNLRERAKTRYTLHKEERRKAIDALKDVPCADCKKRYPPYVMDFDHLPGTEKLFNVGRALDFRAWSRVLEEVKKCEIVCANCHRLRTHQRR